MTISTRQNRVGEVLKLSVEYIFVPKGCGKKANKNKWKTRFLTGRNSKCLPEKFPCKQQAQRICSLPEGAKGHLSLRFAPPVLPHRVASKSCVVENSLRVGMQLTATVLRTRASSFPTCCRPPSPASWARGPMGWASGGGAGREERGQGAGRRPPARSRR